MLFKVTESRKYLRTYHLQRVFGDILVLLCKFTQITSLSVLHLDKSKIKMLGSRNALDNIRMAHLTEHGHFFDCPLGSGCIFQFDALEAAVVLLNFVLQL